MKDIDKGFKETIAKLLLLQSKTLQAGVLASAGTTEGVYIADYANWNEYGTKDIPARSFIRSTRDEQSSKWDAMADEIVDKIIDDPTSNIDILIGRLGSQMVGDIQETISNRNILPKLEDATAKRKKGSYKTLIDSGNLVGAINYEIVDK